MCLRPYYGSFTLGTRCNRLKNMLITLILQQARIGANCMRNKHVTALPHKPICTAALYHHCGITPKTVFGYLKFISGNNNTLAASMDSLVTLCSFFFLSLSLFFTRQHRMNEGSGLPYRPVIHQHFQTSSPLKPVDQLEPNFIFR